MRELHKYVLIFYLFQTGHGNFGSVMKGLYTLRPGKNIAVAVKTLKEEDIPSQKVVFYFAFYTFRLKTSCRNVRGLHDFISAEVVRKVCGFL